MREVDTRCAVHPNYTGERKKRWSSNEKCTCKKVYEEANVPATVQVTIISSFGNSPTVKIFEVPYPPQPKDIYRKLGMIGLGCRVVVRQIASDGNKTPLFEMFPNMNESYNSRTGRVSRSVARGFQVNYLD